MHQDALTSSKTGNGSDKGIREAWLPLFDRYGVDLVAGGVISLEMRHEPAASLLTNKVRPLDLMRQTQTQT